MRILPSKQELIQVLRGNVVSFRGSSTARTFLVNFKLGYLEAA